MFRPLSQQTGSNDPTSIYEGGVASRRLSELDEVILLTLRGASIKPSNQCSDSVFIRRIFLDMLGTIPSPLEVQLFLRSQNSTKRSALIEHLFKREEYADYWAMKWCDILRVKAEFPIKLWPNAVQAYHRWIRTAIKENMTYDQFVRELLTTSGSNFRAAPVNFYRAVQDQTPEAIAKATALTLMGVRTDNWSEEKLAAMGVFFSRIGFKATREWKEEIVFFDPSIPLENPTAVFPDGRTVQLQPDQDPRIVFSNWLINPANPFFAKNIVNRLWAWVFGRGIIHEPDDIRPDNPPSNPELLESLEQEFVSSECDLQHMLRLIFNSRAYQRSSISQSDDPRAEELFAHYPLRRLEAEVLIDAICQITSSTEDYSSAVPEPFTFIPEGTRSVTLADAGITSSFLEMFGRPSRDTGLTSERSNTPTPPQRLHLLNSSHIMRKFNESPGLRAIPIPKNNPDEAATKIYLTVLSRFPTETELQFVRDYVAADDMTSRNAALDLAWALINSPEFLYRH